MTARQCLSAGSWLAFIGVGLGAFGAHALKTMISPESHAIYEVGVRYHLLHAVVLVALGLSRPDFSLKWIGPLFASGCVVFGGSLYLLALTGMKWLGAITPIGGVCFLAGWVCLGLAARREANAKPDSILD